MSANHDPWLAELLAAGVITPEEYRGIMTDQERILSFKRTIVEHYDSYGPSPTLPNLELIEEYRKELAAHDSAQTAERNPTERPNE